MTSSRDMHSGASADNEMNDLDFLNGMVDNLDNTTSASRDYMTRGTHPDVAAFATNVMLDHTQHMATAMNLTRQLGMGASPSGSDYYGSTSASHGVSPDQGMGTGMGRAFAFAPGYYEQRAAMTAASVDNLPDADFAYIEPGGSKDASGKTTPRSKRHFPIQDAAHVRNALARAPQSPFGKEAMPKILAAAKKFGIETSHQSNSNDPNAQAFRSVPFDVSSQGGDGLTLEGYAAVFNTPTRISGWEGDFDETISPGAFARSLGEKTPVLMFEHGRHPLLGSMPLGVITRAVEDANGLHIQARLSDNWLIQPVRDAVRDGAVTGMSFRFSVPAGGDTWQTRSGEPDLRTITEAKVAELGPVVFPAYEPTTAQVRSLAERMDFTGRPGARSPGGGERVKPRQGVAQNGNDTAAGDRDRSLALRLRGVI